MKKLITLVAGLFILIAVNQAQTLQGLFSKYADDERFEYVSVGKGIMGMASVLGGLAKNDKEIMSKMRGIKILTLNSSEKTSMLMRSVEKELKDVLEVGDFETMVEAREKGEKVHIYYRINGKDNADMLIVSKEESELSLIWISGKMTKEEMMKSLSGNDVKMELHSDNTKADDSIS
jgi:transcriptional regulator of NAD metabolism